MSAKYMYYILSMNVRVCNKPMRKRLWQTCPRTWWPPTMPPHHTDWLWHEHTHLHSCSHAVTSLQEMMHLSFLHHPLQSACVVFDWHLDSQAAFTNKWSWGSLAHLHFQTCPIMLTCICFLHSQILIKWWPFLIINPSMNRFWLSIHAQKCLLPHEFLVLYQYI